MISIVNKKNFGHFILNREDLRTIITAVFGESSHTRLSKNLACPQVNHWEKATNKICRAPPIDPKEKRGKKYDKIG